VSDELRIVLTGPAKEAHDKMLVEARNGKTSINSSGLINWIVTDYFARYFERRKDALCKAHFNERKHLLEAMKIEDPEERRRALQEAARNLGRSRRRRKNAPPTAQKNGAENDEIS
jgi:hypothetical protein